MTNDGQMDAAVAAATKTGFSVFLQVVQMDFSEKETKNNHPTQIFAIL